tara:strand:+ start:224 stop:475 length:252 start_codon:yes stop_codon:yes gene_type:complete
MVKKDMRGKTVRGKSKTTAILLAVFLSHWAWVYTYRDNSWKFWLSFICGLLFCWTYIVPIGFYIWVIIDNCTADQKYFEDYWK